MTAICDLDRPTVDSNVYAVTMENTCTNVVESVVTNTVGMAELSLNKSTILSYWWGPPQTGFLCVYPRYNNLEYIDNLWMILQHPDILENLTLVGKSYGSGAIKIEPRALEHLPIPETLVYQFNQNFVRPHQIPLFRVSDGHLEYNPKSSVYWCLPGGQPSC